MATLNNSEIRQRIDSHTNWNTANPTLGNGEFAISNDKSDFKIGDGTKTWRQCDYIISNNPSVTGANTAAGNAQTAAGNAQSTANTALQTAQQALASSGRKEPKQNEDPYGGHSDAIITVDNTFYEKYKNYDFDSYVGEAGLTINIDVLNKKVYENANEVRFHYVTADGNCSIKCPAATRNISDVAQSNKILIATEGDAIATQSVADWTNLVIPANCVVELRIINTWLIKVVVVKL